MQANTNWKETEKYHALERGEEIFWLNEKKRPFDEIQDSLPVTEEEMKDAEERLARFAPFIETVFPETKDKGGIIESPLAEVENMRKTYFPNVSSRLFLKMDSHLAIAGSVKARGGIYEVLKHTEDLAKEHGLLTDGDYRKLADPSMREVFSQYTIQVGSTGNLGLSIGISSAKIGYKVIVHMSADAKEWKKELLRAHGVIVKEYEDDYSLAVKEGRAESDADPKSYFIDDENSKDLFMGYSVAALRLKDQLVEAGVTVDGDCPLAVYIPCGVGGAPGGITYGLKTVFGDDVHVFFIEPTEAPCMLLGMMSGEHEKISVKDIGLTGKTEADGLAVGRPSGFVGGIMDPLLDGIFTIEDEKLNDYLKKLYETEDIFIEPSAASSFQGVYFLKEDEETKNYFAQSGLENATHICWATGGNLVPAHIKEELLK